MLKLYLKKVDLNNTIGEVAQNNNLKQLRIAETEKYPHVTYFMSGVVTRNLKENVVVLSTLQKLLRMI